MLHKPSTLAAASVENNPWFSDELARRVLLKKQKGFSRNADSPRSGFLLFLYRHHHRSFPDWDLQKRSWIRERKSSAALDL